MAHRIKAPMHKNRQTTMSRISGLKSTGGMWGHLNLGNNLYGESAQFDSIEVFSIDGPHGAWLNYKFSDILNAEFKPTQVREAFGPTWTTHWFRIKVTIPASMRGKEVHLSWDSGCEAMIYSPEGRVLQGISPGYREEYILTKNFDGTTQPGTFYVEMGWPCSNIIQKNFKTYYGTKDGQFF